MNAVKSISPPAWNLQSSSMASSMPLVMPMRARVFSLRMKGRACTWPTHSEGRSMLVSSHGACTGRARCAAEASVRDSNQKRTGVPRWTPSRWLRSYDGRGLRGGIRLRSDARGSSLQVPAVMKLSLAKLRRTGGGGAAVQWYYRGVRGVSLLYHHSTLEPMLKPWRMASEASITTQSIGCPSVLKEARVYGCAENINEPMFGFCPVHGCLLHVRFFFSSQIG